MFDPEFFDFSFWWLFPFVMIALCFFMMRGWKGKGMCGFGSHGEDDFLINPSDSAMDIRHDGMRILT